MSGRVPDAERQRYTRANLEAWQQAAPLHERADHAGLLEKFARPGFSTLNEDFASCLGDIELAGRSVLQLCCNNARDLLSVRNLGAGDCCGLDASAAFIHQALALSRAAGHQDVEFVVADLYEAPTRIERRFDIVMTTIGVLGWMPDLAAYFRVIAAMLRPGGHYVMEEMHPLLNMYEEREDGTSFLKYSYFKQDPWIETTSLDYLGGTRYQSSPHYSFPHTLSAIVNAALATGLVLRRFDELNYDISLFCADLEQAEANPPLGLVARWQLAEA